MQVQEDGQGNSKYNALLRTTHSDTSEPLGYYARAFGCVFLIGVVVLMAVTLYLAVDNRHEIANLKRRLDGH